MQASCRRRVAGWARATVAATPRRPPARHPRPRSPPARRPPHAHHHGLVPHLRRAPSRHRHAELPAGRHGRRGGGRDSRPRLLDRRRQAGREREAGAMRRRGARGWGGGRVCGRALSSRLFFSFHPLPTNQTRRRGPALAARASARHAPPSLGHAPQHARERGVAHERGCPRGPRRPPPKPAQRAHVGGRPRVGLGGQQDVGEVGQPQRVGRGRVRAPVPPVAPRMRRYVSA